MTTIRMVELCAQEKLGRPDAVPIIWERLNMARDGIEGCRVTFVDPDPPLFKSGPRKGKPNWSKATNQAVRIVTDPEVAAFSDTWTATTGKCADCMGSGEQFFSWSAAEGTTMKPCPECDGSGSYPKVSAD